MKLRHALMEIEFRSNCGDPLKIVASAIEHKKRAEREAKNESDSNLRFDHVWCVLDVDQHSRLPQAQVLAARNQVKLAISNPCFELWALLHFVNQTAHLSTAQAQAGLERHMAGYKKKLDCSLLAGGTKVAADRALSLESTHAARGEAPGSNPSSGVHTLLRELLEAARASGGALDLADL